MTDRKVVEEFLKKLKEKMKVFDVAFRPREKNTTTLAALDITPSQRLEFLRALKPEDYYSGPHKDSHDPQKPDFFEFGIQIKQAEV